MKKYYQFICESVNDIKEKQLIFIIDEYNEYIDIISEVRNLIKTDFNVNYIQKGFWGYTLLMNCGLRNKYKIANELLKHPDIDVFIKSVQGYYFIEYFHDKTPFIDYELQKTIIKNNPKNIELFYKFGIEHPDIRKEYPQFAHLGTGFDLNLL